MKVPNGNPPAPQNPDAQPKAVRPAGVAPAAGSPAVNPAISASAQLAELKLANRETVLARVAEISNQQAPGASRLLLDVRGQSIAVNASIGETALEAGDWVKIMRAGNELQLMGKLAPAAESTIARALAQRLPWQQSVDAGLMRALATLTGGLKADASTSAGSALSGATRPLPPGVRQAIEQLVTLLPGRQTLATLASSAARGEPLTAPATTPAATAATTPASASGSPAADQVRQWITQSGLFAESRTARATGAPPADLKLALGRVVHQLLEYQGQAPNGFNRLTPIPSPDLVQSPLQFPGATATGRTPQFTAEPTSVGQMLRLLAGVLNRITVNQLHSQVLSGRTTADAPAPNNTLLIDLPWLNQNGEPRLMQLRVEEKAGQNDAGGSKRSQKTEWKLALAMNLDQAGPMHFDVVLGFGRVSARVWAEKQSTLYQARELLPELRRSLVDIGLEVTDLECRKGIPQGATTQLEHRLVDTRA